MSVPVEFGGISMGELQRLGGIINEMDVKDRIVVIQALIPERQFSELALAIKEWTHGRGKVERQPNLSE
jgi:translation elongation factor EF-G